MYWNMKFAWHLSLTTDQNLQPNSGTKAIYMVMQTNHQRYWSYINQCMIDIFNHWTTAAAAAADIFYLIEKL